MSNADDTAPPVRNDTTAPHARSRDIYSRRPVSTSRGRTHERIMALQRPDGVLPGAEDLLTSTGDGSIGAAIREFHTREIVPMPVTSRRAYERTLVLFARDLAAHGPALHDAAHALRLERLCQHFAWRVDNGLDDRVELTRCAVHLARFATWTTETGRTELPDAAQQLRDAAARTIAVLASIPEPS